MTNQTIPILAFTIANFCTSHSISRAYFYELKKKGKAPRLMYVGSKPLVTVEAAQEWRESMTASTESEAA